MKHKMLKKLLLYFTVLSMTASLLVPFNVFAAGEVTDIPLAYLDEEYTLKGDAAQGAIPVPDIFMNCASTTVVLDQNTRVTGWSGADEWTEEDAKGKDDAAFHFALAEEAGSAGDLAATIFDLGSTDDVRSNMIGSTVLISMDVATSSIDPGLSTKGISAGVFYDSTGSAAWPTLLNFEPGGTLTFDTYKTSIPYEANKWYNVMFEITADTSSFKAWVDGVPVTKADGTADISMSKRSGQTTATGFRVLRGLIKTVSGQKGDLYLDNVYVAAGETYSTDRYNANSDAASLSFYKDLALLNTDINAVTTDLSLPTRGAKGSQITWETSDASVIDASGKVTRDLLGDRTATLTATIKSGSVVNTKSFDITVAQKTEDLPLLEEALDAITFDAIKNQNTAQDRVTSAVELPNTGLNDATIEWMSSDERVIALDGTVTRYAESNMNVRLTAVVTVDGNSGAKSIDVVVPGDYVTNDPCLNFDYTIEQSSNIAPVQEPEFGFSGFRVNNSQPLDGQYVTYAIRSGDRFKVSAIINGEPQDITFQTGDADDTYTDFTAVTRTGPTAFLGSGKGWYQYEFVSDEPVAEGQVSLKINMGTPSSNTASYITGVQLYEDGEMTFDDIKGENDSSDEILYNMNFSVPDVTFVSNNPAVLSNDGIVTRPEEDTTVQVTADSLKDGVSSRKIYTFVVKSASYVNPGDDLGFRDGTDAEFTDDFTDFSNWYDSSPQEPGGYAFGIRHWEDTTLGLTHAVSQNHIGDGAYFTYKMDGDITGFVLNGYFSRRNAVFAEDMQFEVSPDGVSWTRLSYENGEVMAAEKVLKVSSWYTASFSSDNIPEGTRYLKVIFGDNTTHGLRYAVLLENITLYSEDDITRAVNALDVADYCHGESLDGVMTNIDLPTDFDYGTTITWTSSNPDILSNTGEIYQNNFIDYSYPVTLEAVISKRGFTKATKTFELVIKKDTRNFTDMDYVNYDLSKVTFESFSGGQSKDHVVDSMELPESPEGGSTFSWSATSPVAEFVNGYVNFTPDDDRTTSMNLVLTATYNGASASKEFPITVIRGFSENKLLDRSSIVASSGTVNPVLSRSFQNWWESEDGDTSPIIEVAFDSPITVNGGLVVERGNNLTGFKLEASSDGTKWETLYEGGSAQVGDMKREMFLFDETEAQYFRFTFYKPADALASLYTLELYRDIFTPEQAVDMALENLSVPRTTKEDLTLPTSAEGGVTITWRSSNENVIANDGTIYKTTGRNRSAVLTATASCEDVRKSRTFSETTVINDITAGGGGGTGGGNGGYVSSGTGITPLPPANDPIAEPTQQPTVFGDVTTEHWAHNYIFDLLDGGVVSSDVEFRPEDSVTREEFLKMLLLGANIPLETSAVEFSDVDSNAWYAPYVAAAYQAGIVYGMGDGTFGIGQAVTREDIAVMTARILEQQGKLTEEEATLSFADSDLISDYARTAVEKLTQMEILNGKENNMFAPTENATRAEAAKIICVMRDILSQQ